MSGVLEGGHEARGVRVALVVSRFNDFVTEKLLAGAVDCLDRNGGGAADRTVVRVPGAWELPQAADRLARRGGLDAIVALGAVIRGETSHFDWICHEVARGLGDVARRRDLPVIFGVLTAETAEQALARAGGDKGNKGWEAALAALEMAGLYRRLDAAETR